MPAWRCSATPGMRSRCSASSRARCASSSASASCAAGAVPAGALHNPRGGGALLRGAAVAGGRSRPSRSPRATSRSSTCRRARCPPAAPRSNYMLRSFPLTDVIRKVLTGSGECARVNWRFLGLAMPAWVLLAVAGSGRSARCANFGRGSGQQVAQRLESTWRAGRRCPRRAPIR